MMAPSNGVALGVRGNMLPRRSTTTPDRAKLASAVAARAKGGMDAGFGQKPATAPSRAATEASKLRSRFNPQQEAAFKQWTGAAAKAQPHGPAIPWEELVAWQQKRQGANDTYLGGLARNEQLQAALGQRGALEDQRFAQGWDKVGSQINYGDARRGMLRSGVNRQHWTDYGGDRTMALRELLMGRQGQYDDLAAQRGDLERRRALALAGVDQSELYRRAQLAQLLQGAR